MSNIIVMAFSRRNIVGCLLIKGLQRGGHGHPRTLPPPRYALATSAPTGQWVSLPGLNINFIRLTPYHLEGGIMDEPRLHRTQILRLVYTNDVIISIAILSVVGRVLRPSVSQYDVSLASMFVRGSF